MKIHERLRMKNED